MKKMRRSVSLCAALLFATVILTAFSGCVPSGPVTYEKAFPDPGFQSYVLNELNGKDGTRTAKSEVTDEDRKTLAAVEIIDIQSSPRIISPLDSGGSGDASANDPTTYASISTIRPFDVVDLTGIEYFTGLKKLHCFGQGVTRLDLSKNTALIEIQLTRNKLKKLNISKNTALLGLDCSENQLTKLDVSNNAALVELDCTFNRLTKLDVSKNTKLTLLNCAGNRLSKLNGLNETVLESLNCAGNSLTKLDLWANNALVKLDCERNKLTILDVSGNTGLVNLICHNNKLTELDISNNKELENLYCDNNKLTGLNVAANTKLNYLDCARNYMKDESAIVGLDKLDKKPTLIFEPQFKSR